jgi:hypothetical protein
MTTIAAPDPHPLAETLATIDALITRAVALSQDIARCKQDLADLAEERRLREAVLALSIEGKNDTERQARLRLELSSDADYRRMRDAEREARARLAEAETALWAAKQRLTACLALLRLAADAETGAEAEGEDAP